MLKKKDSQITLKIAQRIVVIKIQINTKKCKMIN